MASEMLVLAVDTSTPFGSVAILRDGRLVAVFAANSPEGFSTRLFRYVECLSSELRISMVDIDLFAVNAGPGSFTGLRVGLTAVKAWAEVYGKPIAPVSGLEAIAAQYQRLDALLIPVIDARRGQIFGGVYRKAHGNLEMAGVESVLSPREFLASLSNLHMTPDPIFISPDPEALRGPLAESAFRANVLQVVSPVLAPWIGQIALRMAYDEKLVDSLSLQANYIRRSDAELHGAGA